MTNRSKEMLVGALVIFSIALVFVFGWLMGLSNPFSGDARFEVLYGFAGGVEIGSPVRVSGVKVGKVERIDFLPEPDVNHGEPATIKVVVSVSPRAVGVVRADSKFYVNMAGIIGERYVEISPGSLAGGLLAPGSVVRGIDPPRLDQLLSQGYGVFGRVQEFLDKNEKTLTEFLENLGGFLTDANKMLKGSDKRRFFTLIDNLNEMSSDLKSVAKELNSQQSRELFNQLSDIVDRTHHIDDRALRKFLQEEGIRARIF